MGEMFIWGPGPKEAQNPPSPCKTGICCPKRQKANLTMVSFVFQAIATYKAGFQDEPKDFTVNITISRVRTEIAVFV